MKKKIASLLILTMVLALFACGSTEPEDTTPRTYTSGTYMMESYTKNGESLGEEVLALYEGAKYVLRMDGTCSYTVRMNGAVTETAGTYAIYGEKLIITLDYGKNGMVELIYSFYGDSFCQIEQVGADTYTQTYRK